MSEKLGCWLLAISPVTFYYPDALILYRCSLRIDFRSGVCGNSYGISTLRFSTRAKAGLREQ